MGKEVHWGQLLDVVDSSLKAIGATFTISVTTVELSTRVENNVSVL